MPKSMRGHLRRNLLLGVALAAVTAGVVIAVAPGGAHHRTATVKRLLSAGSVPGDVQLAADYLGISRAELRRRLRTGATMAEVADATPGRSADGLITALLGPREAAFRARSSPTPAQREALARSRAQIVAEVNHGHGRGGPIQTAAGYLAISQAALRARLRSGRSLAQIAVAEGRSRAGLIEALASVKAARLRTALAEHAITPGEEKTALATLHERVSAEIEQHLGAPSG